MNDRHDSDCATHNEPAYPNGPCDCSLREEIAQIIERHVPHEEALSMATEILALRSDWHQQR